MTCRHAFAASLLAFALALTGCIAASPNQPASPLSAHVHLSGVAMGGEQPITASTIHLYQVGTSADASAATDLLGSNVVTTSDGSGLLNANANAGNANNTLGPGYFTLTGDFTCPTSSTLVYLAAVGGNPGAGVNTVQNNIAVLGTCGSLNASTFITINEITTVGTVAALHSYMSAFDHIGSGTSDLTAFSTAFNTTAAEYVSSASGTAPGPALPSGYDASSNDLRALANSVQACTNSTGSTAASTPCANLFTYARGSASTAPTDTVTALIDIFAMPTNNVANIFSLQAKTPAFYPTYSAAPNGWTLPIQPIPTAPVILPKTGSYTTVENVSITGNDPVATIYYTTDGSTPTSSSAQFTGNFYVTASSTVSAIAVTAGGRLTGPVGSATLTLSGIITPTVGIPAISIYYPSSTAVPVTATDTYNGSTVTFGVASPATGTFSPTTCVIASNSCTVNYIPTGTLLPGVYSNDFTASFSPYSKSSGGTATSTLTIFTPYTVLDNFTGTGGTTPGSNPYGNLIQAKDGNFYGMTQSGGQNNLGTVFSVNPAGTTFTVLHSFASADGDTPTGSLVQGSDGNFYGLTSAGGANSCGTIFSINSTGTVFTVLHSFTSASDGKVPYGALIQGTDGNFYGMTSTGSYTTAHGTIFSVNQSGTTFIVLHSFIGTDGGTPNGALVQGSDGNFYGMTETGGAHNGGTIFSINSTGTLFTLLRSLTPASDGQHPYGALVQGTDGDFYGMNLSGGNFSYGTVFKMNAVGTAYTAFLDFGDSYYSPFGSLVLGSDGNFYGMTNGGYFTSGTIFSTNSTGTSINVLHNFNGTTDGGSTHGSLLQGSDGNFYGMTYQGGTDNYGAIFNLTMVPALAAPVILTVPTAVTHSTAFTLGYAVSNATSTMGVISVGATTMQRCFATNTGGDTTGWTGVKTAATTTTTVNLTAPATAGTYTYTLTCGGVESGFATLNVQ